MDEESNTNINVFVSKNTGINLVHLPFNSSFEKVGMGYFCYDVQNTFTGFPPSPGPAFAEPRRWRGVARE